MVELVSLRDYQGGCEPLATDSMIISKSGPEGHALFNFKGPAEFFKAAIHW